MAGRGGAPRARAGRPGGAGAVRGAGATKGAARGGAAGARLAGEAAARGWEVETLETLEANVDDMSPEVGAFVCERLLEAGARDAWLMPATMKKGRQAVVLGALCEPGRTPDLLDLVFRETPTLGVRVRECERVSLRRRIVEVDTRWGPVRVKVSGGGGATLTVKPEYDDCAALARSSGAPLVEVAREALQLAQGRVREGVREGTGRGGGGEGPATASEAAPAIS